MATESSEDYALSRTGHTQSDLTQKEFKNFVATAGCSAWHPTQELEQGRSDHLDARQDDSSFCLVFQSLSDRYLLSSPRVLRICLITCEEDLFDSKLLHVTHRELDLKSSIGIEGVKGPPM